LNENSESIDQNNITINTLIQSASSSSTDEKPEPTHYSKLDLKKLRVDDLRAELLARNLDTKGLKAQLLARLKEAVEIEKVISVLILFKYIRKYSTKMIWF